MSKDKIIDEYLEGDLPFSDLYRKASEGERCPDYLAARILAKATRWGRLRSANSIVKRLQREIRSRYAQHRIWIETVLSMAVGAVLVIASQMIVGNDTKIVLECRAVPTVVGQSLDQSIQTRESKLWLDQIRRLRQEGLIEEANAALAVFRQRYPDHPLGELQEIPTQRP